MTNQHVIATSASRIDSVWTLAALYGMAAVLSLPLQRAIWAAVAWDDGPTLRYVLVPLAALWCLAVASIVAAAWMAPRSSEALASKLASYLQARARRLAAVVVLAMFVAALAIAFFVLDAFPNSGDEYAYLFQARRFAEGRLWAHAPPLGYTFVPYRTWISDGKWLSQYPPGWPLALSIAIVSGIATWVVNPLLGAAGAASLTARSWNFADNGTVATSLVLYGLTPFYLLNAGSYHSHVLSALLIVLLCLCCLRYRESGGIPLLAIAGALLGLVGVTRYFSLVLLGPALVYWFFVEIRRQRLRAAALIALGGLPFLLLLMGYQYLVTGDPFRSTYTLIADPDVSVSLAPHDILHGLILTAYRLVELGVWVSPILLAIYLFCLVAKLRTRSLSFYDLIFPCFVLGFIFFPTLGGNRYGPRYYFEAFPLMLATILSAAPHATAWARRLWDRPLAVHAVVAGAFYLAIASPFALAAYHDQIEAREEPYRLAAELGLSNAIVVLKTTSGPGLLAEDLARNDPALKAPVLYARDYVAAGVLEQASPGRAIWVYMREDPTEPGRLAPLRP